MIALGAIATVTGLFNRGFAPKAPEFLSVNPTTVALTYLIVILVISTGWGIAEATAASVLAVVCFNFFFLPPVGTFTIADPQNWVAFLAFLITAVVTSQLSGRARQRAIETVERQRDLERLYALSRSLLLVDSQATVGSAIARHIADAFQSAVGVYDQQTDRVAWAGTEGALVPESTFHDVARRGTPEQVDNSIVVPLRLGGSAIGSLAIAKVSLSDTVLHSVMNLAAIGLERSRAQEATVRAEAAQQSSELRAAVLDSLAHEFKTPLTSIQAAAGGLLASTAVRDSDRELATIVEEDVDRLQGLVSDAVHMLRVDAGQFVVHPQRLPLSEIVAAAVRRFDRQLDGHQFTTAIPESLTVDADRELLDLALRQVLDNALKYSPASSTIEVRAAANGTIDLMVSNTGSAIPDSEQAQVFDRFYRGTAARGTPGTGMGLAIVRQIAEAHGGTLTLNSSADAGTTFTLSFPRQRAPA